MPAARDPGLAALHAEAQVTRKREDFEYEDWCWDCCLRHTPERRRAIIRRMGPEVTAGEVRDAWPHFWAETDAGERMLTRDLEAVFGRRVTSTPAERLELALRMVERGMSRTQAMVLARVCHRRLAAALRAQGLEYEAHAAKNESGWRRKRAA